MNTTSVNGSFNKRQNDQMSGRKNDAAKTSGCRGRERESLNQFEYNTNGFNRNHRRFVGVRGCPKVRGANKRDEAAMRREKEIKEKFNWRKRLDAKRKRRKRGRKKRKKAKNKRQDKVEAGEGRMDEVEKRPGNSYAD